MMEERDWVLRLARQFAELLKRLLKLESAQPAEVADAIRAGCSTLLGVEFDVLALVDAASAVSLLRDVHRVAIFARLLEVMGEVAERQGQVDVAQRWYLHACEVALAGQKLGADASLGELLSRRAPVP
jgi:hypothetical protein